MLGKKSPRPLCRFAKTDNLKLERKIERKKARAPGMGLFFWRSKWIVSTRIVAAPNR